MASITITPNAVNIRLSVGDKALGCLGDQTIPLGAIRAVMVVANPGDAISGRRSPGLAMPGGHRVGTWRTRGQRTFVCVWRRGPVLCIDAPGTHFDRYVIAVDDTTAIAERLNAAMA